MSPMSSLIGPTFSQHASMSTKVYIYFKPKVKHLPASVLDILLFLQFVVVLLIVKLSFIGKPVSWLCFYYMECYNLVYSSGVFSQDKTIL